MNAWSPDHKQTNIPIMKTQNLDGGNALPSEFYVEDGSYLRLKNIQLGYTLNGRWTDQMKIGKFRIFAGVQNLVTLTAYSGFDPEVSSNVLFGRGVDNNSYPNAMTVTCGFNLTF